MKKILVTILLLTLLQGCAGTPEDPPTAAELYEEATEYYNAANYAAGDDKFDELAATYPTSLYTQQAILDQLYSFLKRREYGRAVAAADRFVELYPDHPQVPYALYMKGVTYFREDRGILDQIGKQDPSSRDSKLMRLSFEAFQELVTTYPDSKFSPDATVRMRYLINNLARYEIHIASYYFSREAYPAAIGRAENVLAEYPDSTSTEAALILLFQSYKSVGARAAAADTRRLLEINFPDSPLLSVQ